MTKALSVDLRVSVLAACPPSGPVRKAFGLEEWRISGSS